MEHEKGKAFVVLIIKGENMLMPLGAITYMGPKAVFRTNYVIYALGRHISNLFIDRQLK